MQAEPRGSLASQASRVLLLQLHSVRGETLTQRIRQRTRERPEVNRSLPQYLQGGKCAPTPYIQIL